MDNYLSFIKKAANKHSGNIISRSLVSLYAQSMSKDEKRPPIEPALYQQLKEELRPMVQRTANLTQLDLLHKWHY